MKFLSNSLKLKCLHAGSIFFLLILLNANILCAATATLSWSPPTANADGSNLTDLNGYVIYIGTSPDDYTQSIDVGNVNTYILSDLVSDITYYFAVTSYDTSGNESDYSNQASIKKDSATVTFNPVITITDSVAPMDDLLIQYGDITEFNSLDQTVMVKNDGNADLVIGNVVQVNPLSASFSIFDDNCSYQSVIPSDSCLVTVRFSPTSTGSFAEIINIPSNDNNKSIMKVALKGNGLSSDFNNPPSEPELVSPENRGKGKGRKTGFKWKKSSDPDGDPVTYDLNICQDPDMTIGCETQIASVNNQDIYYAGIGSFGSGLLFFGMVFVMPFNKKYNKIIPTLVVVISITSMLFLVSCGGSGGIPLTDVDVPVDEVRETISDLEIGTTYYWQVVAKDSKGGKTYSPVWSFETE